ncbi:MAG: hypothetical protein AAFO03_02320 [Bacteroidota bacterium]
MLTLTPLVAQEANDGESTPTETSLFQLMLEPADSLLIAYAEEVGLLDGIDWKACFKDSSYMALLGQIEQNWQERLLSTKVDHQLVLTLGSYYTNLDTTNVWSTQASQSLRSYVELNNRLQIGEIPIQLGGIAVFEGDRFQPNLSNIRLGFSAEDFLRQKREEYLNKVQLESMLTNQLPNASLSPDELKALKDRFRLHLFSALIRRPEYIQLRQKLEERLNEVSNQITTVQDSLKGAAEALENLVSLTEKYRTLWNSAQEQDHQLRYEQLQQKLAQLSQEVTHFQSLKNWRSTLGSRSNNHSWKQRILALTKDFNIGQFTLSGSPYTLRHVAINGIQYAWESDHAFGHLAYGQQGLQVNSRFLPLLRTNFLRASQGRRILSASVGAGQKDASHLSVEYARISESNDGFTVAGLPQDNTVFAISSQVKVTEATDFELDLGWSAFDNFSAADSPSTSANIVRESIAFEGAVKQELEWLNANLGIGYFYVGPRFLSLGNPFLLTNRQGIVASMDAQTENGLHVSVEGRWGNSITEENYLPGPVRDWQIIGNLQWPVTSSWTLLGGVSPNTFQQSGGGEFNLTSANFLYYAQSLWQYGMFADQQSSTVIGYSNFRSDLQFLDTLSIGKTDFFSVQQTLPFSARQAFDIQAMWSGNTLGEAGISSSLYRLSYQFNANKLQLHFGGQLLQLNGEDYWRYGSSGQISWQLASRCFLTGFWQLQRPIALPTPWQVYSNLNLQILI